MTSLINAVSRTLLKLLGLEQTRYIESRCTNVISASDTRHARYKISN